MGQHIDRISLKFAETTVDLDQANKGFEREIERVSELFMELMREFVNNLEEKRIHNESLLRGAGLDEKEIKKVSLTAKKSSD